MKTLLPFVVGAALSTAVAFAQDIQGAEKALQRLAAENQAAPAKAAEADPRAAWQAQVSAFEKDAITLAPDTAASRWLELIDAYVALPATDREDDPYAGMYDEAKGAAVLIKALPPPRTWEALAKATAAPRAKSSPLLDASLQLLVANLQGDDAGAARARGDILKLAETNKAQTTALNALIDAFDHIAATLSGDPKAIVAQFEKRLTAKGRNAEDGEQIAVPDLVTLVGPTKAEELLQRALLLDATIGIEHGETTRALAAKVALKNLEKLRKAPWSLIRSTDDVKLYEALAKKFPKAADDSDRQEAAEVYLVGLIAAKRTADASKLALELHGSEQGGNSLSSDALETLISAGRGKDVLTFLNDVLEKHPELPFWDQAISLAARLGEAGATLTQIRRTLTRNGLDATVRRDLQKHLRTALLAADEVEEGVKLLQESLRAERPKEKPQAAQNAIDRLLFAAPGARSFRRYSSRHDGSSEGDTLALAMQLASLGKLLERPEWIDEGVKAGLASLAAPDGERNYNAGQFASLLLELGRKAEAEDVLIQQLIAAAKEARNQAARHRSNQAPNLQSQLAELAAFYHRAGRPQDVLALVDQAKEWGISDLAECSEGSCGSKPAPLSLAVATALATAGRTEDARRVADFCLDQNPGLDDAYALLVKLGGERVMPRLDELFARDQFEERPLIWKASLQLQAGQIDDAEKTIRAAIAIDPSDGEQGKGDRMRAYSILAGVLERKGDDAQAKIMREAVAAIRISEDADDWWSAGLLSRAVKKYEEALGRFADAYCIQSRLALRYAELGNDAKAMEHYRRAYELMPESFGRVESHCFGCEGAFSGARAQSVAEKVFGELALKLPNKPQVFYLLGYLREQQDRHPEALNEFRRAVTLDPDYLNAWEHIASLGENLAIPAADRDDAALNLLRLDPQSRHSSPKLDQIRNLRALWDAVAIATQQRPAEKKEVHPLAASKAALEAARKARPAGADAEDAMEKWRSRLLFRSGAVESPGAVLANHQLVKVLAPLIDFAVALGAQ